MQHDLFANPYQRLRRAYPLLVLMQADIVEGPSKVVAPAIPAAAVAAPSRLLPVISHDGARYAVMVAQMTNMPARALGRPVGSVAAWRDDLTRALDWLFFGI